MREGATSSVELQALAESMQVGTWSGATSPTRTLPGHEHSNIKKHLRILRLGQSIHLAEATARNKKLGGGPGTMIVACYMAG